ncbi:hypothetical protein [Amycolatopsis sp. NPDC004378]
MTICEVTERAWLAGAGLKPAVRHGAADHGVPIVGHDVCRTFGYTGTYRPFAGHARRHAQQWAAARGCGDKVATFTGRTGSVKAVACAVLGGHPVGVTADDDGTVRVWDLTTGDQVAIFDFRCIGDVAIGPGGELMITAGWELVVLDRIAKH